MTLESLTPIRWSASQSMPGCFSKSTLPQGTLLVKVNLPCGAGGLELGLKQPW